MIDAPPDGAFIAFVLAGSLLSVWRASGVGLEEARELGRLLRRIWSQSEEWGRSHPVSLSFASGLLFLGLTALLLG